MQFTILPFLTGAAFILPALAQLSNEVPPPVCLVSPAFPVVKLGEPIESCNLLYRADLFLLSKV